MIYDRQLVIPPDVMSQEVSGETVLLNLKSETYFGLDELGTRIWQLLLDHQGTLSIVDTLLKEYDVNRKTLETDVTRLLDDLLAAGLLAETK